MIATDAGGCKFNSAEYCAATTGIQTNILAEQIIDVYPNPNTGDFNVKLQEPSKNVSITLYSFTGNLVYHKVFEGAKNNIYRNRLSHVANGMYILKVKTEKGVIVSHMQVGGN